MNMPYDSTPVEINDVNTLIATPVAFLLWLRQFKDDEIIGEPGDGRKCPAACWLSSVLNERVIVGSEDVCTRNGMDTYLSPAWLQRFVETVDREGARGITAAYARAILGPEPKPDDNDGDVPNPAVKEPSEDDDDETEEEEDEAA